MPKLWTCQEPRVVETLLDVGTVRVDLRERSRYKGQEGDLGHPYAYRWLADRLDRVIPGYGGELPWWLHTVRPPGSDNGTNWILEFDVPDERCFVMPYWAWDMVFCRGQLPLSKTEWQRHRREVRRMRRRTGLDAEEHLHSWAGDVEEVERRRRALAEPLRSLDGRLHRDCERLFEKQLVPSVAPRAVARYHHYRRRATFVAVTEILGREDLRALFDPSKGQWESSK